MARNVNQKDQTLNEIIDRCEQLAAERLRLANTLPRQHDMGLRVELDTNKTYYLKSKDMK